MKADEFRRRAEHAERQAALALTEPERAEYLKIAGAWRDLIATELATRKRN
jgi:hypothetical protein